MKYYLIDNDEDLRYEEGDEDSVIEYCVSEDYFREDEDSFKEWFDENEGSVYIAGYSFEASDAFKELDEGAYYDELSNWAENEADNACDEARYEFRHVSHGDTIDICGYTIHVYEEDEESDEDEEDEETFAVKLTTQVEVQIEQEKQIHEENRRLEDAFMAAFQTIKD